MSETITLDWLGAHVRTVQADLRSVSQRLDQMQRNGITRQDVFDAVQLLVQRVATCEALLEARVDQLAEGQARILAELRAMREG